MTWQRERNRLCEWCRHETELHELNHDQRVPKEVESGVYRCSDCAECELKAVTNG